MRRTILRVLLALLSSGLVLGSLSADDDLFKDPLKSIAKEKGVTGKKESAGVVGGKRDNVAEAFALPKGVTLRPDQDDLYRKLKREKEPKLRQAQKRVDDAPSEQEKTKAAREMMALTKEIKQGINTILQKPDPKLVQAMEEAMKAKANGKHNKRR
jgi:hypothetical protein